MEALFQSELLTLIAAGASIAVASVAIGLSVFFYFLANRMFRKTEGSVDQIENSVNQMYGALTKLSKRSDSAASAIEARVLQLQEVAEKIARDAQLLDTGASLVNEEAPHESFFNPKPNFAPALPNEPLNMIPAQKHESRPQAMIPAQKYEDSPQAEIPVQIYMKIPQAEVAVLMEGEIPQAEVPVAIEEETPQAEIAAAIEGEIAQAEVPVAIEEETPQAEVAAAIEEEIPQAEVSVAIEEETPQSEVAVEIEEEIPQAEIPVRKNGKSLQAKISAIVANGKEDEDMVG